MLKFQSTHALKISNLNSSRNWISVDVYIKVPILVLYFHNKLKEALKVMNENENW